MSDPKKCTCECATKDPLCYMHNPALELIERFIIAKLSIGLEVNSRYYGGGQDLVVKLKCGDEVISEDSVTL